MTHRERLILGIAAVLVTTVTVCCLLIVTTLVEEYAHKLFPQAPAKYDCALAEITPDFTTAMREACRKLRSNS